MGAYCNIHPKVQVEGEYQDSILYGQIKEYTFGSYEPSNDIYFAVKQDITEKRVKGEEIKLPLNSQNEVQLDSLLQTYDVREFLPKDFNDKLLNHFNLKETNYTTEDFHNLMQTCEELNNSIYGNNYFASVKVENGTITPTLGYKTTKNKYSKQQEEQKKSNDLYNKVSNILENWGIKIDALTDAEERLGINGIADFNSIEKATDGFYHIVRLAKGVDGEESLPEEFGHVVYRALEDKPLMQRTFNLIKNNSELIQEILGDNYNKYAEDYNNDEDLLAEEAVGKLIAVHFLQQMAIDNNKIYSKILGRTINNIEDFFKKFNETELSNAIHEVNKNLSLIVKSTMAGNEQVNPAKMRINNALKQIDTNQERIKNLERIVAKIIVNERKRKKLYKNNKQVVKKTSNLIKEIVRKVDKNVQQRDITENDYVEAILNYLEKSNIEVKKVLTALHTIKGCDSDILTRSHVLRNYRNVIFSYVNVLKDVQQDLYNEFKLEKTPYKDRVNGLVNDSLKSLGYCLNVYNNEAMELMTTFWSDVLGEDLKVVKGTFRPREINYTVKDLLEMNVEDISWFDRMLDSMAHSNNYLLKGIDKTVKDCNNKARLRTIEFNKKISTITKELERAGYKDQKWMFEVDEKGHKTGRYISNESNEYKRLSAAQKKYYDVVMQMKAELESLNPPSRQDVFRTVKIRKDLLERIKTSHNPKEALHAFTEKIKEGFLRNSTDTEYGMKLFVSNFEGFEYQELPIFYTYLGPETSEDDISTDIVSTFTAYASSVYKNDEMAEVIDILEMTRAQIRNAKTPIDIQGGNRLKEATGVFKRKDDNNILQRLNAFYDMQIYGKTKADEGTIGNTKIDVSKAIDRWIDWNSSLNTAFNVLMNISNVMTGNVQFKMEGVGGQFFNYKDALTADKIFTSRAKDFIADLGNRTKSSWFYVVSEAFDVMQDYDHEIGHKDFDKKWYERLSINGLSMIAQNAGEIWMQHRTFFALMNSDKEALIDNDGNKIKALDAFDVVPLDKSNPNNGAELVFKKGLKDTKGNKIIIKEELKKRAVKYKEDTNESIAWTSNKLLKEGEISESDYIKTMSRKSAALNQYMHGIYNEADKAAIYQKGLGRLAGQYRKWIKPSLNRRFKATTYNYDLDSYVEGTYITVVRFLMQNIRDVRAKQFDLMVRWNEMEDYEKSNVRKVCAELTTLALIILAIQLLPDDDDIKEETYLSRMYRYQLYRLKNEIGVLTPSPYMVTEGLKIINSPMAGINTLEKVVNCKDLLTPWTWKEITSGRYKGLYRPLNSIIDLVPYHRAIYKTLHPEEGIAYFL